MADLQTIPAGAGSLISYGITDQQIAETRAKYASLTADTPEGYEMTRRAIGEVPRGTGCRGRANPRRGGQAARRAEGPRRTAAKARSGICQEEAGFRGGDRAGPTGERP